MAKNRKRHVLFLLSIGVSFAILSSPMVEVIGLSLHDPLYSHIPLIPVLSGFFLFLGRRAIFHHIEYSPLSGMALTGTGALLCGIGFLGLMPLNKNDYLSLMTFSALMIWLGLFALFYGFGALRKATFPLLFLLCMVPVPTFLLNAFVLLLQKGSAETVNALLHLLGMQMTRDGYTFHFPQLSIEIWESCTGIRASIALLITSIVASHLFLAKGWARTLLILSSIPITILKNALRIVVLSLIGVYVDEGVFDSHLHNVAGGAFFFIFALFLLWTVIMILNRVDSPLDKETKSMGLSA
ncbi:MAG TPA: hypothetical protein DCR97_03385 [Deltaproteobacteria bacterium]|nr:hypothetical protein [Deltaproteobacteria bacterium]